MKQIPKVQKYMTAMPDTVNQDIPLARAAALMDEKGYRHLPVLDGDKLVGLLSDRDVKFAMGISDKAAFTVEDVMSQSPLTTSPESDLDDVVIEMAEHKFGSVVVQSNGRVVGIFTATDGLRVLAEILRQRFHK